MNLQWTARVPLKKQVTAGIRWIKLKASLGIGNINTHGFIQEKWIHQTWTSSKEKDQPKKKKQRQKLYIIIYIYTPAILQWTEESILQGWQLATGNWGYTGHRKCTKKHWTWRSIKNQSRIRIEGTLARMISTEIAVVKAENWINQFDEQGRNTQCKIRYLRRERATISGMNSRRCRETGRARRKTNRIKESNLISGQKKNRWDHIPIGRDCW